MESEHFHAYLREKKDNSQADIALTRYCFSSFVPLRGENTAFLPGQQIQPLNPPLLISKPCFPLKFFFFPSKNFEEVHSFLFRKHSDPSLGRTALNFAELSQPTLSILPWLNKTSTIPWNKYQCWATYEHKKDSWNNQEHTSRILGQRSSHDIYTVCSVP